MAGKSVFKTQSELKKMGESRLKSAILLTIAYSDQFDFPLTSDELYLRLIWRAGFSRTVTKDEFSSVLQVLAGEFLIETVDGYYCLPGRHKIIATRAIRQKYAEKQREELQPLLSFLKKIPWIEGVVVTGSLALNAISSKDDSDFLLVVSPNRLWLTRILVIFYAWIKGKRRSWQHEEENSWCFNLWLDTNHLRISKKQRSVYMAYEVCQADWLWWRGSVAVDFLNQNAWVKNLLPQYWEHKFSSYKIYGFSNFKKKRRRGIFAKTFASLKNLFVGNFLNLADYLVFKLQLWYMKPHRTREKVGRGMAFFHPRDTQSFVNSGWRESLVRGLTSQAELVPADILAKIKKARFANQKIVLVTGVFDLFHQEHLEFLKRAKKAGDFLLVGIESDKRVKEMKGEDRPIVSQEKRLEQISKLNFVDCAFVLPDNFGGREKPRELIDLTRPDILAVSSHSPHLQRKRAILKEFGGRVEVVHQHNPKVSTSKIIEERKLSRS